MAFNESKYDKSTKELAKQIIEMVMEDLEPDEDKEEAELMYHDYLADSLYEVERLANNLLEKRLKAR